MTKQFTQAQFDKFMPVANKLTRQNRGTVPANAAMAQAVKQVFPQFSQQDCFDFNTVFQNQSNF